MVNTGFALPSVPARPLPGNRALWPAKRYFFWLEVGSFVEGSIEITPQPLPVENLPEGATLVVALFGFPHGISITPGADLGKIALQLDGSARVVIQPDRHGRHRLPTEHVDSRLYFPVRTPLRFGEARLRCNIYYEQVLVQSRLVSARIRPWPWRSACALAAKLEYSLSRSLAPGRLRAISPHRLSVMLNNDDRSRTHQFRFLGERELKADVTLRELELDSLVKEARKTMRRVAWGTEDEWNDRHAYRYEGLANASQLSTDLISLARAGFRIYDKVLPRLADGSSAQEELESLMASRGLVQFASKGDVREYLPAALIYDYPLDTNLPSSICPVFLKALDLRQPLAGTPCFSGRCPSRGDLRIVCPSGFWGFRHEVSFPLSTADDVDTVLNPDSAPTFAMAVSTALQQTAPHEKTIHTLRQYRAWRQGDSRAATLRMLQAQDLNIVYFYCHGGLDGAVPFIQVGPLSEPGITRDNLRPNRILWSRPGPLVFINGCRTTALQPSIAFDLVSVLVEQSKAAGVIGTEITVFEPLACTFAENFFRAFLVDDQTIGAAVRRARLSLLEERNPLGLVYVLFALASISLTGRTAHADMSPGKIDAQPRETQPPTP